MIKRAPSPLALGVITLFVFSCFSLLLYLWVTFGGPSPLKPEGYRFQVRVPEATQLNDQADVRISGVPVGKVVKLDLTGGDTTLVTIEMRSRYAPVPRDTRVKLRLKGLLGETYVELTQGDRSKGLLADGGMLTDTAVSPAVEIDEVLRTFDAPTRAAFRTWVQSQAEAAQGRGADINAALGVFPGFVDSTDHLLATLDSQSAAVRKLFASTGDFFSAISERDGELSGLISDSNRLFQVTARRNRQFAAIWEEFPRFERESRLTLPPLTRLAKSAEPVVRRLQPAASEFEPTFDAIRELGPDFRGFFERLGPVITVSGRGLPSFKRILGDLPPLLGHFDPWLRNVSPIAAYLSQHRREMTSFFANVTSATLARDLNLPLTTDDVHYLRTAQTLSPTALSFYPRPLGSERQNAYLAPGGLDALAGGLPVYDSRPCANGDVAPPDDADPPSLAPLIKLYAFRTDGRTVARPGCHAQGAYPGFGTAFPQLHADR